MDRKPVLGTVQLWQRSSFKIRHRTMTLVSHLRLVCTAIHKFGAFAEHFFLNKAGQSPLLVQRALCVAK
ncbi:hypothetical protein Bhyg_01237 [Pseudolycoriella hygida]|uniref:Uncharacterized protein n=1 Tax=Pseudolycoriella hygida TaxID=35572 RepID=A0A9Q0S6N4_9DIPT|nr:hypothetical protein Bhyg_01237 [Pseudolycoriella hygida]